MSRRALLLFAAMCVIWGIPYLFIRIAVTELPLVVLVFARTAGGALILIPTAPARGELRGHAAGALALVQMALVVAGYAIAPAILSRYLKDLPSVGVIAAALGLAAIAYLPATVLQWPHTFPSLNVIASVVVLTLICTVLGFLLFFALIGEIGPVRATVFTYINPAVAALLGVVALHEGFTVGMAAGFVL